MIVAPRFVFLHLHKSGGTFVNDCLLRFVPGARSAGYHLPHTMIPPESRVGIHRMFVTGEALRPAGAALVHRRFDAGGMRAFLKEYSSEMGIDPGLISAAETVPSEKIRILTTAEIRRWHLGVPTL